MGNSRVGVYTALYVATSVGTIDALSHYSRFGEASVVGGLVMGATILALLAPLGHVADNCINAVNTWRSTDRMKTLGQPFELPPDAL